MFKLVSSCCHREIVESSKMEYPLGGTRWGISYKVELCSSCGKEADPVEACGGCGVVGCRGCKEC